MSEKPKIDKPQASRINRYGFLILWVLAQLSGWATYYVSDLPSAYNFLEWVGIGLIIGVPTAVAQKFALYLHFGRSIRGWIRWNVLGWVLGAISISLIDDFLPAYNNQFFLFLQVLSLMFLPSLAQAWVLRKQLERAWLISLSAVAGSSVFAWVLGQFGNNEVIAYGSFAAFAFVSGLTLLWLYGMQKQSSQLKAGMEIKRLEDTTDAVESEDIVELVQDELKR